MGFRGWLTLMVMWFGGVCAIPCAVAQESPCACPPANGACAEFPAVSSELADDESSLFAGSQRCALCHTPGRGALTGPEGENLSIVGDWRFSMMRHSFRDPLFRAVLESEANAFPDQAAAIEDRCLTCHAPMARTQAHADGEGPFRLAHARPSALAGDGVSCSLCHQIDSDSISRTDEAGGHFQVGDRRLIFGPYPNVVTGPMRNFVNYTPTYSAHVGTSEYCAVCHNLFTPVLNEEGEAQGLFPEQTPYFEWANSIYAAESTRQSCQDCHMPLVAAPVKLSNRPPWLGTQEPFWRHTFAGANAWMLQNFRDMTDPADSEARAGYDAAIADARKQLSQSVTLKVENLSRAGDHLEIQLLIENQAGHKFPTAYPARRAWARLTVHDAAGGVVFDSGRWDEEGEIVGLDPGYEPHHDVIDLPDQVQVYQAVLGDLQGNLTYDLLRASRYLKDNRIPPKGFDPEGPHTEYTAIQGAARDDPNFNRAEKEWGTGRDRILYRVAPGKHSGPFRVVATMQYQTLPPRFAQSLLRKEGDAVNRLRRLWENADRTPIEVARVEAIVPEAPGATP